ncbi:LysR family transcriptional regulator [Conexibacter woesei]|uniref:Transcriptional regulator, LysR family n=1 Tax=Conexibacter woesei (strain DSM 14684 / CCUG 47730 / CIP 108061 / JCM 11494 / NBRC 100937 / ID131577) TaxID=469383 RepID=D3F9C3_CONWI|nr:LysR family transcriptional regulator [Conexibacter woesei]ADB49090.1 transcriptional regulator, LysR family [Conexibacter woesei DSM 14684]
MQHPEPARPHPLDLRQVVVLEHIDRGGTISAAADALNFSCSGLSQQLRRLEGEVGTELVSRSPREATLTPAGRVLMNHAVYIQERLAAAEREVREISQLRGGRLRVATFRSVGETLVADAVAYFRAHWPGVRVTLREGEPEDYLHLLRSDEIDIALTFEYDGVESTVLDQRLTLARLCEDEMVVVLPASHRLAGYDRLPLDGLRHDRWVVSTPRCSVEAFTAQACRAAGFEARVLMATDNYRIAQALVAHGDAVTFLPRLATRALHPGCVARPVGDGGLFRRIYAAHRVGGERAPALARMLEVLREVGGDG